MNPSPFFSYFAPYIRSFLWIAEGTRKVIYLKGQETLKGKPWHLLKIPRVVRGWSRVEPWVIRASARRSGRMNVCMYCIISDRVRCGYKYGEGRRRSWEDERGVMRSRCRRKRIRIRKAGGSGRGNGREGEWGKGEEYEAKGAVTQEIE